MSSESGFELKRKFGFKESREEREQRLKGEKRLKWQQKLEKEDLQKLQKELDSMERASFLAPQQKERKRLVERMVADLSQQEAQSKSEDKSSNTESHEAVASKDNQEVLSSSDEEVFGVDLSTTFSGANTVETFLPRTVKMRRVEKKKTPQQSEADAVKAAEQQLSAALRETVDDFDEFLDSL